MKEKIKRLIALILALAMSLSLLSANVWASEETDSPLDEGATVQSDDGMVGTEKPEDESAGVETPSAEESDKSADYKTEEKGFDTGELRTQGIVDDDDDDDYDDYDDYDERPTTKKKLKATKLTKVTVKKKTATVTWKKNTTGKGYQLQCSTNKKFKKPVKTFKIGKNTITKATIKKLKKGTYYLRIRTIKGKKHSGWSKIKKVKVK